MSTGTPCTGGCLCLGLISPGDRLSTHPPGRLSPGWLSPFSAGLCGQTLASLLLSASLIQVPITPELLRGCPSGSLSSSHESLASVDSFAHPCAFDRLVVFHVLLLLPGMRFPWENCSSFRTQPQVTSWAKPDSGLSAALAQSCHSLAWPDGCLRAP